MWRSMRPVLGVVVFTIFCAGCASPYMRVCDQEPAPLSPIQARVVFMRYSRIGSAIKASILDRVGDGRKLVGILNAKQKIAYDTKPGKHTFILIGEIADFIEADLEAGKTYYVMVTPQWGCAKARFAMRPFKQIAEESAFQLGSKDWSNWRASCTYVTPATNANEWMFKNGASIQGKIDAYEKKVWDVMPEKDKQWKRLEPQDGE